MNEAASLTMVAQIAIAQLASFASLLLAVASLHKLYDYTRAAQAVQDLTGLARTLAVPAALGIAAAEFVAAIGLWIAPLRFDAALLAALIWSGYFVFLLQAVAAGRSDIDCGCSFATAHRPLGLFQMLRAALLALLGFVIALSAAIAPGALAYDASMAAIATQVLAGARPGHVIAAAARRSAGMSLLIASQIVLWIAVLALGTVCIALARQIGVLHQRIAPAGALSIRQALQVGDAAPQMTLATLEGAPLQVGGARAGRSQLILFLSPDCAICESLLPSVRSAQGAERQWLDIVLASDGSKLEKHAAFVREKGLGKFPYVLSEALGRSFGVAKLPFAVLIDEAGKLAASGLVNSREHLESLFIAKEIGVSSIQAFIAQRDQKRALSGE